MSDYKVRPPILVIEDNQATKQAIVEILEVLGYDHVSAASSGGQTIKILEQEPKAFPIVLIDIFLTDMTAKHLASRFPRDHGIKKLLILSGGTADDFAAVCSVFERRGIAEVHTLKKPASLETLQKFLG